MANIAPNTGNVAPHTGLAEDDRNQQIMRVLEAKGRPVLPFELSVIEGELAQRSLTQRKHGELLRGTMTESSETWHDNAAADLVAQDANNNAQRARALQQTRNGATKVAYPPKDFDRVTLGSIVGVRYPGDPDLEYVVLVGAARTLPEAITGKLPEDMSPISLSSPKAQALFDAALGSTVRLETPRGFISVEVAALTQIQEQ